jgi:hypothetical protein
VRGEITPTPSYQTSTLTISSLKNGGIAIFYKEDSKRKMKGGGVGGKADPCPPRLRV